MRVLILMRGSAGCGKSTFIKENGLKPYTLCADDLRLMCQSPVLNVNGSAEISQKNDKVVWDILFKLLEVRMQKGEFTVIDATNSKTAEMNRYKDLAKEYRYRIYCIDMTDVPIEETKRRNAEREPMKRVPEEVIDKFYARFNSQKIPSGIQVIKPTELYKIDYRPFNASDYNKVHIFGDIHGCYSVLMEYFNSNGGIKADELYIFTGDYIDRGIENAEIMKWLIEQYNYKNMIFLEGNHERWLWLYANDKIGRSKEFEFVTKPQLEDANIKKSDIRQFYRKLAQCSFFYYDEKIIIVTHGGLSGLNQKSLIEISTEQMIKGVGGYNDADKVDEHFCKNSRSDVYSIHGHRNILDTPIQSTENTFNLENHVEFGGNLRVVQLDHEGFHPVEIQNTVFKVKTEKDKQEEKNKDFAVYEFVESLKQNKRYISEKKYDYISSFNFTRNAFENKVWNSMTNKARGLFIDMDTYKVAARSYDKFFNINERPETQLESLKYQLVFPVTAYVKENGFLGIVSYDKKNDDLLFCSKSTVGGQYAEYMKNLMYKIYGDHKMKKLLEYIKENDVSFVFECCDIEHDPHIIEYVESTVILLDVIKNDLKYKKLSYEELFKLSSSDNLGLYVKEKAYTLNTWEEFYDWYMKVTAEGYEYEGLGVSSFDNVVSLNIEGFVIEDSAGYMTKLKLHYYNLWKKLRGVAKSIVKYGNYRNTGSLLTPMENDFFGWCKEKFGEISQEEKEEITKSNSVIKLRDEFLFDNPQYKQHRFY